MCSVYLYMLSLMIKHYIISTATCAHPVVRKEQNTRITVKNEDNRSVYLFIVTLVMAVVSLQLQQSDPVWTVELHRFVSTKLKECEHTHGPSQFQLLLHSVDWSVREQMCEYMPSEQAVKLLAT